MKFNIAAVILISSVFSNAYAEGGSCPDGFYPIASPGVSGCAPIPGYGGGQSNPRMKQPMPRWADSWGALAFSEINGAVGVAARMSSEQAARESALSDCRAAGGEDKCKLETTYYNQCVALAWGEKFSSTSRAETVELASGLAMKACDKGSRNCKIVYSECSLPRRI